MATITKREIAERIAKETGQTQVVTKDIIQRFLDEIIDELTTGNKLEFRDFGIFEVVKRRSRNGRNPKTGTRVFVPAKRVVSFKMGRRMKKQVADRSDADYALEEAEEAEDAQPLPPRPVSQPPIPPVRTTPPPIQFPNRPAAPVEEDNSGTPDDSE